MRERKTILKKKLATKSVFIWDFDGCLADTEHFHYLAYAAAFRRFGHEILEEQYYPTFTHFGNGTIREITRHNLTCRADDINQLKAEVYWDLLNSNEIAVFPEIRAILGLMRKLGYRIAIASNSPPVELELILQRNGLSKSFDVIIGRTAGLKKKPSPDTFLLALEKLGASPLDSLVLEDSERGLEAAKNATIEAIWIRTRENLNLTTDAPHLASMTHLELLGLLGELSIDKK